MHVCRISGYHGRNGWGAERLPVAVSRGLPSAPVERRRVPRMLFEKPAEVIHVIDSHGSGDISHAHIGGFDQPCGHIDFGQDNVGLRGRAGAFLESVGKSADAEMAHVRIEGDAVVLVIILADIFADRVHAFLYI